MHFVFCFLFASLSGIVGSVVLVCNRTSTISYSIFFKVLVLCLVMNNSRVNENTVSSSSELNHHFIADSLQLTDLTSTVE